MGLGLGVIVADAAGELRGVDGCRGNVIGKIRDLPFIAFGRARQLTETTFCV